MTETIKPTGLALLREPFPAHQISKLPKPYKKDSPKGRCNECGGYHGLPAVHLDYVGHAALTDRLLDCDPAWSWEPLALNNDGYPVIDGNGGMWIKLTVCNVTRLGYGDAQGKTGGDAMKERIGDALRNAAMRFGAALDLWHKGDLHGDEDEPPAPKPVAKPAPAPEAIKAKAAAMKADSAKAAKAQKPVAHVIEGQATTITGDPSEGDLSCIGGPDVPTFLPQKPTDAQLGKVVHAFAAIGYTIEALEKEYGKRIDEWDMDDMDEARRVYVLKAEERKAMLAQIAAESDGTV